MKPTLEWVKAVVLDHLLARQIALPAQFTAGYGLPASPPLGTSGGRDERIIDFVGKVLARVMDADSNNVQFRFSHRNMGMIAAEFVRSGLEQAIPNLLGLSAGQAALFCMFSNVIRDFDLAGAEFNDVSDVRGIVLVDEADLHLHVNLQYQVLPNLMKLVPKVQFIVTAHSPLLVMGIEKVFGDDGFRAIELPSGEAIETEAFSEFGHALAAFTRTRAFEQQLLDHIQRSAKPVVIVEGKWDVIHINTAWDKLHPGQPIPWDVVHAAASRRRTTGAGRNCSGRCSEPAAFTWNELRSAFSIMTGRGWSSSTA